MKNKKKNFKFTTMMKIIKISQKPKYLDMNPLKNVKNAHWPYNF